MSVQLHWLHADEGQTTLPVFCVSARDCHRIEGRLPSENKKATFSAVKDTQLPELRAHVHTLTGTCYFSCHLPHVSADTHDSLCCQLWCLSLCNCLHLSTVEHALGINTRLCLLCSAHMFLYSSRACC